MTRGRLSAARPASRRGETSSSWAVLLIMCLALWSFLTMCLLL